MMADGRVYYAERDAICVIRFEGVISYTLGPALDRFLDDLFARGECTTIIADLADTESIDSTGLGLLARIAKFVRRRDGARPVLFSSRPDINAVLRSICMDEIFVLCDGAADLDAWQAIPPGNPTEHELARSVLDAHRLLCEMNENNRAMFQSVVDAFERDPGKA